MSEMDLLINIIMRHSNFLDKALDISKLIIHLAQNGNIDGVDHALENRERLINLIDKIGEKAENIINGLEIGKLPKEQKYLIDIIKTWAADINLFSIKMSEWDNQIKETLFDLKDNIRKEIAMTHRQKEKFKGYNLSSFK